MWSTTGKVRVAIFKSRGKIQWTQVNTREKGEKNGLRAKKKIKYQKGGGEKQD